MGLKLSQNINFWLVFRFLSVSGRDKAFLSRQSFLVATLVATYCLSRHWSRQLAWLRHWSRHTACRDTGRDSLLGRDTGRDILPVATYFHLVATYFLTATCFSSPTCRGHNFFILTRIWACEYSLESSWNVECSHEGI